MCGRQPLVVLCPLLMRMQWQNLLWPPCLPACFSQPQFGLRRVSSCTAQSCCPESWSHRNFEFLIWRWCCQNRNPWRWSGVFLFDFCLLASGSSVSGGIACFVLKFQKKGEQSFHTPVSMWFQRAVMRRAELNRQEIELFAQLLTRSNNRSLFIPSGSVSGGLPHALPPILSSLLVLVMVSTHCAVCDVKLKSLTVM